MPNYKNINNQKIQLSSQEENELQQVKNEFNNDSFNRAIKTLRNERDLLLNQTDWIVIKAKETGTTIPTAWKTYRQALRDITENLTTVEEVNAVVFPEKP